MGVTAATIAMLVLAFAGPPAPRVRPDPGTGKTKDVGGVQLSRTAGGGYLYKDTAAGFTAEIKPDGTVRFRDSRLGPQQGKVTVLGFDVIKGKKEPPPQKPFRDDIVPHGPYGPPPIMLKAGGKIGGLSDALLKSKKYKAKQRFLTVTATMRGKMAAASRDRATKVALFELTHKLLKVWRNEKLPLSVRKDRLFAEWDDCDEPAKDSKKADRHPGARARRRIEKFIRVHASAGSENAFTNAELRDMNQRRKSRERFAPYKR